MDSVKKRAERNGKVRKTVAQIEQTIDKLERMKTEYIEQATAAKRNGEAAAYSLAKSGINTTLSQIKRAKEMLLNIQITAELQKMGETNADFLSAMSTLAKRIKKVNKQSDFVKLQKQIDEALYGAQQAQLGLDCFLQNSDAAFATIAECAPELSDDSIDKLIDGTLSEKDILTDAAIERLNSGTVGDNNNAATELLAKPTNAPNGKKV